MNRLPYEINIEIFLYLSQKQRNTCLKTVCRKWNDILKDPIFYLTIQLNTVKQWMVFSSFALNHYVDNDIPLGHYVRRFIFKKENINHYYSYDYLKPLQIACPFITQLIHFPFMNDMMTTTTTCTSSSTSCYESAITAITNNEDNHHEWNYLTHLPLEYTHVINWQQQQQQQVNHKKKKKKITSLQLYYYHPVFNHDNDINSYENKRLRIKLLERQRRQKLAQKDDFWRVIHTNHTEFLWHTTNIILSVSFLSSFFMNLSHLDINFDLYFLSSADQQVIDNDLHQQSPSNHHYIIDTFTLMSLFNACSSLNTLKLRYLNFNISNQHNEEKTLFHSLKSLEHLYLDHCTFLNPQCFTFFTSLPSTCKSILKTLDMHHMRWPSFINIHHLPTILEYKNKIYLMITSFPLLSRLNIDFQLKNEENNEWNSTLLPNVELLEWLTDHPNQLSYFGYQYELLLLSFKETHYYSYYLNHLTTLHIKKISPSSTSFSLLYELTSSSSSSSSIVLSTSIKTLILSGEKKKQNTSAICYIYHWLNVFPNLKSLKISKMKINTSALNYYHSSYHHSVSPYYSSTPYQNKLYPKTKYYQLRELIIKKSEFIQEDNRYSANNNNGFEMLLNRCFNINKMEITRIKFSTISSLWYQPGNYKSTISYFVKASHLKLDYLKIMEITFSPTSSSSVIPSSLMLNHPNWDPMIKHYKVLYTIEEIGSTKHILHYSKDNDEHNSFTINFHLTCQSIDQMAFY
ncbi:unnamed protein product [Cunninghamella blakesleeana]